MAQLFKKGDLVRLKSGGPPMTVKEYGTILNRKDFSTRESETNVFCIWFNSENKLMKQSFDQETLEKYEE